MNHTLNLEELNEFIKVLCLNLKVFDKDYKYLEEFYDDALSWDRKLFSLNHLLSRVIEKLEKEDVNYQNLLDYIYSLENRCNFEIQEGSIQFIESLFKNDCGTSLTLEEELIIAQNRICK